MVVLSHKVFARDGRPNPVHTFDAGAAFENLALQAATMGLVVHGMAGFYRSKAGDAPGSPTITRSRRWSRSATRVTRPSCRPSSRREPLRRQARGPSSPARGRSGSRVLHGWLVHVAGADREPPHPPFGHLLPGGEKGTVDASAERQTHGEQKAVALAPPGRGPG